MVQSRVLHGIVFVTFDSILDRKFPNQKVQTDQIPRSEVSHLDLLNLLLST